MSEFRASSVAATMAGVVLALALPASAVAGPMRVARSAIISPSTGAMEAVYRRPARRHGVGPGAVLGLFGAIVGGAIASQRYNNYSSYAYGSPNDYGCAPGYLGGPCFAGGGGRGGDARRVGHAGGGRISREGVGARGGGAHATHR